MGILCRHSLKNDIPVAFNFFMSIPIRASDAYYSHKGLITKGKILLNINSEQDYIKTTSICAAVAITLFDPLQRDILFNDALKDAKHNEKNVEYVLCVNDWLCPAGDQYGALDWLYDQIF